MPWNRPTLNEVKVRFYTSGQLMLLFGIMFAAFAEQNFKAFGVYLGGTIAIYTILSLIGIKWPNQDAGNDCGNLPWLLGAPPEYIAPSTTYYWFTLVYFITVGILQHGSSAQNAGVVSLATIFAVLDIAVIYFGNLSQGGPGQGGTLIGGRGACWTKVPILIGIAIGSCLGGLYGWGMYEGLKSTEKGPDISCAKENNPKRFRCKVRDRKLDI